MSAKQMMYDEEFKKNAVKLSYASPKTIKQVAEDLGVNENQLFLWRKKYTSQGNPPNKYKGEITMSIFDTSKIKKDIDDLKTKKETLLHSLQKDIDSLLNDMNEEYRIIGQKAYGLFINGEDTLGLLKENFDKINQLKEEQNKKDAKKSEISERYNEEITIMEKLLPDEEEFAEAVQPVVVPVVKEFCTNCGKEVNPIEYVVCLEFGTKVVKS